VFLCVWCIVLCDELNIGLIVLFLCSVEAPESSIADFVADHGECCMAEENVDDPLPLQEVDINVPDSTPKKRRQSGASSPEQRKKSNMDAEVGITVKYDFGWDKRGSGFRYASDNSPCCIPLHCVCVVVVAFMCIFYSAGMTAALVEAVSLVS